MKQMYPLLFIMFSACTASIGYLGNRYPPTEHVEVFVDAAAIKKPYTIIGKGYEEPIVGNGWTTVEGLQKKAVEKARKVGADAILFHDYLLPQTGTTIRSSSRTDTLPGAVVTNSSTYAGPVVHSGRQILFLKYN